MKAFEEPIVEVQLFQVEDIITTSTGETGGIGGGQELERD